MSSSEPRPLSESGPFAGRVTTVTVGVIVVTMLIALGFIIWQKSTTPAVVDYEGAIVDRWADTAETQIGSRPRWVLLVENDSGARFTVRVDSKIYDSARVGMRIKSEKGQIVLLAPDKAPR